MAKPEKQNSSKPDRALQILDAAAELLGESGYDGVSARDIAERAGLNKALVFYYWGSKPELFGKVLERYYDAHRDALEQAFRSEGTLTERMHRVLNAYLDFIEENRIYPRLVQQQLTGGGPHTDMVRRHLATFFEWITEVLAEVSPKTGPLAAKHFYLSISGIVTHYFTVAPAIAEQWGCDPMSTDALAERREHLHWLVDTLLARLQKETAGEKT
jgi:AcrR family transcriptional regulator